MEYVKKCHIKDVGTFEYYILETAHKIENETITTYGVAVKNALSCKFEAVYDIWSDRKVIMDFINILSKNEVTCVHLRELCEEFVEELYSI